MHIIIITETPQPLLLVHHSPQFYPGFVTVASFMLCLLFWAQQYQAKQTKKGKETRMRRILRLTSRNTLLKLINNS